VENVYDLPGSSYGQDAPYVTQSFSRAQLAQWMEENNARILEQQYWRFWTGDHWTVGEQVIPPQSVPREQKHQLTCILAQKNAPNPRAAAGPAR
jgi:hypothetical protein